MKKRKKHETIQSTAADVVVAGMKAIGGSHFPTLMEFMSDAVRARTHTREAIAAKDAAMRSGKPTKDLEDAVGALQQQEAEIDRRTEELLNAYIDARLKKTRGA